MASNSPTKKTASGSISFAKGPAAIRLQAALFLYQSGNYSQALPEFERLADRALARGEPDIFLECSAYQIRLLAESENFGAVARVEEKVRSVLSSTHSIDPKLRSRIMYVLGICCVYQGGSNQSTETRGEEQTREIRTPRHEEAVNRFRESIQFAIESGDRSALAWPLYGTATVLYARGRYDDAIAEIDKLRTLLDCHPIADLESSAHLLHALIARNQGRLDEALQSAWRAFEALKVHPHLVLYLHTLATLGSIYIAKKEPLPARVYLELAERSLKRSEFPRIARVVDDGLKALRAIEPKSFDLRFFEESGTLIESKKGEIRFDGQHILRDLLRALLKSKGTTLQKEELVRQVWSEDYSPDTHDNKIYVNIKRLRRLIESEDGSTEYILRGKSGYYINPKTRVEIVET